MPTDDEDTPKGALLALTLITMIVLFVVISTFDSCTDLEGDKIKNYCSTMRFAVEPGMRQSAVCFTEEGELKFGIVNSGDIGIDGLSLQFLGKQYNISTPIYVMGAQQFSVKIGITNYELMAPITIVPLVYYPEMNETVSCSLMKQTLKDVGLCQYDE
jgi:hypothetical protein